MRRTRNQDTDGGADTRRRTAGGEVRPARDRWSRTAARRWRKQARLTTSTGAHEETRAAATYSSCGACRRRLCRPRCERSSRERKRQRHPLRGQLEENGTARNCRARRARGPIAHAPKSSTSLLPLLLVRVHPGVEVAQASLGQSAFKPRSCDRHGNDALLTGLRGPAEAVHHPEEGGLDRRHPAEAERGDEALRLDCRIRDRGAERLIDRNGLCVEDGSDLPSRRWRGAHGRPLILRAATRRAGLRTRAKPPGSANQRRSCTSDAVPKSPASE